MGTIAWTKDLETGIEIIDAQHRRIVDYINELNEASQKNDRTAIGEVIDDLVNYTVSHFSFEESLMKEAGYKFLDAHKKVHALFIKKVESFITRFGEGEDVAEELSHMLERWLISHIKKEDRDYVASAGAEMKGLQRDKSSGGWLSRTMKRVFG